METLDLSALLLSLAAIFSYINFRFIKLPTTIGIMLIAILISVSLTESGTDTFTIFLFSKNNSIKENSDMPTVMPDKPSRMYLSRPGCFVI